MRLLICSEADLPSVNMRKSLLSMREWEVRAPNLLVDDDDAILTIQDMHIRHDNLDKEAETLGISVDEVVVMSKHSAKSGQPALTVHPIGNYHEADFGGKEETLVTPAPASMSESLRLIRSYNSDPGTQTCFEVTHHGPLLDKPTYYIEIGSDESNWGNEDAAEILAKVICDVEPHEEYRRLVGVGGGHYAPRFTEVAVGFKANFGHMVPNYQMEGRDDDDVSRMIGDACRVTGTDSVYIHKKSMKGPEHHRIASIVESLGLESVSSNDLDPLQ